MTNAGALDASTLAAGLQGKADKNHTHRAADITDLADAVKQQMAAAMQHQAGSNGYVKLPNGLLRQWGYIGTTWSGEGVKKVVFPVAFPAECFNVQITTRITGRQGAINADLTLGADNLTTAGFDVVVNGLAFHGASVSDFKGVYWEAIGR